MTWFKRKNAPIHDTNLFTIGGLIDERLVNEYRINPSPDAQIEAITNVLKAIVLVLNSDQKVELANSLGFEKD